MRCNEVSNFWYLNGFRYVVADIYADTTPSTFPTDGSTIDGLGETDKLAIGTTIYVISTGTLYMAKSDGTFVEQ
jgi:hypothetical protein